MISRTTIFSPRRNYFQTLLTLVIVSFFCLALRHPSGSRHDLVDIPLHDPNPYGSPKFRLGDDGILDSHENMLACRGPRGHLLDGSPESEDALHPEYALGDVTYPLSTTGSHDALGLEKSWMTPRQRYSPYGFGEENKDYGLERVNWTNVKWGKLQNECFAVGASRWDGPEGEPYQFSAQPRFRFFDALQQPVLPRAKTGRQAVVLRAWSTYTYQPEDYWNLRSIISETSLATGGEYAVILLVDVKDDEKGPKILEDDKLYQEVMNESVPPEFRDIALLFHQSLQATWYEKVGEFGPFWQIMQPLQLLAHFYPEFDHFWQFEMDTRFTGDVGKLLQSFHAFGQKQPYKQARERASWTYMPGLHGTYEEFSTEINKSLEGGATVWGPVPIRNFDPIGIPPPTPEPKEDDFKFGVGTDADLLLLTILDDVNEIENDRDWVFKNWLSDGFDEDVQRFKSVPAHARASWELLEGIHDVQHEHGLYLQGEGTLPSFAFWFGMKVIGLPTPVYQFPERDLHELNRIFNGGYPDGSKDGIAHGANSIRTSSVDFFVRPTTWDWTSALPDVVFDHWMGHPYKSPERGHRPPTWMPPIPDSLPWFLAEHDGSIYAPNMMLHPRKSTSLRPPG